MASHRSASITSALVDCGGDSHASPHVGSASVQGSGDLDATAVATTSMFLNADELVLLTGRHRKAKQIQQLRVMGIPFYVNASGHPVVARAVVNGIRPEPFQPRWTPAVAKLERRE